MIYIFLGFNGGLAAWLRPGGLLRRGRHEQAAIGRPKESVDRLLRRLELASSFGARQHASAHARGRVEAGGDGVACLHADGYDPALPPPRDHRDRGKHRSVWRRSGARVRSTWAALRSDRGSAQGSARAVNASGSRSVRKTVL